MTTIRLKGKFEGALIGLACGDALGYATEFSSMETIRAEFGKDGIQELDQARLAHGSAARCQNCGRYADGHVPDDDRFDAHDFVPDTRTHVALFSDDTQMTIAVARGLIRAGRGATCDTSAPLVVEEFVSWSRSPVGGHRAPGNACLAGCSALGRGTFWEVAGREADGGCGSVMRSAPYGLYFWDSLDAAIECSARHARMTHGAPLAAAASAALAAGVWKLAHGATKFEAAEEMVHAAARYDVKTSRMLNADFRVALAFFGDDGKLVGDPSSALRRVLDERRGWAGHEAICAAMFCFLVGENYAQVARYGANSPGDSDSIACIAGALAGAFYGIEGIPTSWVEIIERRDELLMLSRTLLAASTDADVLYKLERTA